MDRFNINDYISSLMFQKLGSVVTPIQLAQNKICLLRLYFFFVSIIQEHTEKKTSWNKALLTACYQQTSQIIYLLIKIHKFSNDDIFCAQIRKYRV